MVTTQTRKKSLAFRVSREIYDKVVSMTEGDNPPFESVSEYLYSLVVADLGKRELGVDAVTHQLLELLKNPEIKKQIKELLKD